MPGIPGNERKPWVSIVTISLNQGQFLEEAIQSVLNQDYKYIEYIVVDAGSNDGSREIIDRFSSRIATAILELDDGPADGLNKGFRHARGEIFGFLNADDVLDPGAISEVVQEFERFPEVDVISGHAWVIDGGGQKLRRMYSDKFSLQMAKHGASIVVQQSTFFRQEVFSRVGGFHTENRSNWDGELYIDFGLAGAKFKLAERFWSRYRVHGESITGVGRLRVQHDRYGTRMFEKITGRKKTVCDSAIGVGARWVRKLRNPRDTWERLRRGAIFGTAQ